MVFFWAWMLCYEKTKKKLKVQKAVNREIAKFMAWSLEWALRGVGPETGFYNETFAKDSYRSTLAGKTLAGGWKTLDSINQIFCNVFHM